MTESPERRKKDIKTYQNPSEPIRTCQYLSESIRTHQNPLELNSTHPVSSELIRLELNCFRSTLQSCTGPVQGQNRVFPVYLKPVFITGMGLQGAICAHRFKKRGGWNKRGGGTKVAKSLNVEVGINVEGGISWKKLVHKSNKRGVEGGKI